MLIKCPDYLTVNRMLFSLTIRSAMGVYRTEHYTTVYEDRKKPIWQ
jgi:hypothetical protein